MVAFVADFQHQNPLGAQVSVRTGQQGANKVHPVVATGQGQTWFGQKFRRQRLHAALIHVWGVAQNQVVLPQGGRQSSHRAPLDAIGQAMPFAIDAGHGQGIGADVAAFDVGIGVGHGGQHRQTAIARAQVQDALGRRA